MKLVALLRKVCMFTLITSLLSLSAQAPVMAGMISNEQIAQTAQMELKRDEIRSFIMREDVKEALLGQGVSVDDVEKRVDSLTDSEIMQMHEQIDELAAGGSFLGGVLLVVVIFMLLDMAGATDVFPNI